MSSNRKDDHVRHAVDQHRDRTPVNDFDAIGFQHHALAGIDAADVDLGVDIAGKRWHTPLFINAMTA
ncbi:type 2 isopentenyl-diphosphate Delta-isomerase, partial [Mycobacterium tuberculosis]|nr:type 2 isopentenyl-diphosphate Delta-isomerase [Mycobacterium tuberculosis]